MPPEVEGRATAHFESNPTRVGEDALLVELLAGRPVGEAAEAAGISRSTALRIRKCQAFQQRLSEGRQDLLTGVVDQLRSVASDFAGTLHKIAMDQAARGSDRVLAARHGLDLLFRGIESAELAERVMKLEEIANSDPGEKKPAVAMAVAAGEEEDI